MPRLGFFFAYPLARSPVLGPCAGRLLYHHQPRLRGLSHRHRPPSRKARRRRRCARRLCAQARHRGVPHRAAPRRIAPHPAAQWRAPPPSRTAPPYYRERHHISASTTVATMHRPVVPASQPQLHCCNRCHCTRYLPPASLRAPYPNRRAQLAAIFAEYAPVCSFVQMPWTAFSDLLTSFRRSSYSFMARSSSSSATLVRPARAHPPIVGTYSAFIPPPHVTIVVLLAGLFLHSPTQSRHVYGAKKRRLVMAGTRNGYASTRLTDSAYHLAVAIVSASSLGLFWVPGCFRRMHEGAQRQVRLAAAAARTHPPGGSPTSFISCECIQTCISCECIQTCGRRRRAINTHLPRTVCSCVLSPSLFIQPLFQFFLRRLIPLYSSVYSCRLLLPLCPLPHSFPPSCAQAVCRLRPLSTAWPRHGTQAAPALMRAVWHGSNHAVAAAAPFLLCSAQGHTI